MFTTNMIEPNSETIKMRFNRCVSVFLLFDIDLLLFVLKNFDVFVCVLQFFIWFLGLFFNDSYKL